MDEFEFESDFLDNDQLKDYDGTLNQIMSELGPSKINKNFEDDDDTEVDFLAELEGSQLKLDGLEELEESAPNHKEDEETEKLRKELEEQARIREMEELQEQEKKR